MLEDAINRLIESGLSEQQESDLNIILASMGSALKRANQSTVRALQAQQLTELKLSAVSAPVQ